MFVVYRIDDINVCYRQINDKRRRIYKHYNHFLYFHQAATLTVSHATRQQINIWKKYLYSRIGECKFYRFYNKDGLSLSILLSLFH